MCQYPASELVRGFVLFRGGESLRDQSVHVVRLNDLKTGKVFLHMDWPAIEDEELEYYSVEITPEGGKAHTVFTNVPKYNFYPDDPSIAFDIEVSAYGAGGAKRYFVLNVHLDRAKQSQETKQTEDNMDDFDWRVDSDDWAAKVEKVLEYLAWFGRRAHPDWEWVVDALGDAQRRWQTDSYRIKIRQWRGWGGPEAVFRLSDMQKHGLIVVLPYDFLMDFWAESAARKSNLAMLIAEDAVKNAYRLAPGYMYPDYRPPVAWGGAEGEP